MPETNLRALCNQLLQAYEWCISAYMTGPPDEDTLVLRARAALSQPESVAPTDEEIYNLALEGDFFVDVGDGFSCMVQDEVEFARAVLARYGRPPPIPSTEKNQ